MEGNELLAAELQFLVNMAFMTSGLIWSPQRCWCDGESLSIAVKQHRFCNFCFHVLFGPINCLLQHHAISFSFWPSELGWSRRGIGFKSRKIDVMYKGVTVPPPPQSDHLRRIIQTSYETVNYN